MEGERNALGEGNPIALSSLQDYAANCFRIEAEIQAGVDALKELLRLHKKHVGDNSPALASAYRGLRKWLPRLKRESELAEVERLLTGDVEWPEDRTETLIARGASWRYFDGAPPPADFMAPGYDDSGWETGPAPLGYGDEELETEIGFGADSNNKHATACFRIAFDVEGAEQLKDLKVRIRYDDLAAIYLNGEEIASGEDGRNADGLAESLYYAIIVDAASLREGRNVLAAAISQANPQSSDLIFDLGLEGLRKQP
jgi:hypothetical protein